MFEIPSVPVTYDQIREVLWFSGWARADHNQWHDARVKKGTDSVLVKHEPAPDGRTQTTVTVRAFYKAWQTMILRGFAPNRPEAMEAEHADAIVWLIVYGTY